MATYSFQDVQVTLVGPGGIISLGYGAGPSDEGITVERAEDKDAMVVGADGTPMHTLHSGKHGSVSIRLLKTSPANAQLQLMYDLQQASSSVWGQNVILVSQNAAGDIITCRSVAFRRAPTLTYGKEGAMNDWGFNVGLIDSVMGVYAA